LKATAGGAFFRADERERCQATPARTNVDRAVDKEKSLA